MISFKFSYKDLPVTGIVGDVDGDMDMLIEATGTAGIDKLNLAADFDDITLTKLNDTWLLKHNDVDNVTAVLKDIERLENSTQGFAFDVKGNAGEVYALLWTALGRNDVTSELVGLGVELKDAGATDLELADLILKSDLYKQDALGTSNETFVKQVYKNIFDTAPSFADLVYFTEELNSGRYTQASLLELASNLEITRDADHINLVGMNMIEYTPVAG